MGKRRNAYKIFCGKLEGNRQLGRHRRRWKGNIKMDLEKTDGRLRAFVNTVP
jgi:hypothetical protein